MDIDENSSSCFITSFNLHSKFGKKLSATNLTNFNDEHFLFTAGNGLYKCSWKGKGGGDIDDIKRLEKCQSGFKRIVKTANFVFILLGDNRILFSSNLENFQDLRIVLDDDCRIFDICFVTKNKIAVGVTDFEHNTAIQIYDISIGKCAELKKSIKLTKQPISMD